MISICNTFISYHKKFVKLIPKSKLKYLKRFLSRTQIPMREFVVKIKELEEEIRLFHLEPIKYNSDNFLKMILVEACFMIEFFL